MRSDPARQQLSAYAFPPELRVDDLWVRALREEDVDVIAPAFVDPAVGGEAGLPPLDADGLRATMRELLPEMHARGLLAPYVIERENALLGGVAVHHLDPMRDSVEVGYWLFLGARGQGVATRAIGAVVDDAFTQGICRVEAHVRIGNRASERVLERLGFEREGVRRRFLRHGRERVDATLFALLADDA